MKQLIEAMVEDVILQPDKIQPIIVNFQNGELKDNEAEKMDSGIFNDKENKRMLALSNGQIVYKGYRPDLSKELTYTMLAIHNKITGKVRLVQAEHWQVSPVLDKQIKVNNVIEEDDVTLLNKQFGSKRVKRRTEQSEKLKINVESVKEQLEKTISNVEIERADLTLSHIRDKSVINTNLVECNRYASDVTKIYNIYDILPKGKLKTLYDTAAKILKNGTEGKSKFFMQTLVAVKENSKNTKKVAILLYIEAVAAWLNMPIKNAKKRGIEICSFSNQVNAHIIQSYSIVSASGRQRPNSMRDKGVLHCIILALTISNFILDLELFATVLNNRIGIKKLMLLSRIIGAVPMKDNKKMVSLKLPLPSQLVINKKVKRK